jgi:hypothetical protein
VCSPEFKPQYHHQTNKQTNKKIGPYIYFLIIVFFGVKKGGGPGLKVMIRTF